MHLAFSNGTKFTQILDVSCQDFHLTLHMSEKEAVLLILLKRELPWMKPSWSLVYIKLWQFGIMESSVCLIGFMSMILISHISILFFSACTIHTHFWWCNMCVWQFQSKLIELSGQQKWQRRTKKPDFQRFVLARSSCSSKSHPRFVLGCIIVCNLMNSYSIW